MDFGIFGIDGLWVEVIEQFLEPFVQFSVTVCLRIIIPTKVQSIEVCIRMLRFIVQVAQTPKPAIALIPFVYEITIREVGHYPFRKLGIINAVLDAVFKLQHVISLINLNPQLIVMFMESLVPKLD